MNLFFLHTDDHGGLFLDETESRHCIKVLRHTLYDTITGIDGKGNKYTCQIIKISKKQVELELISKAENWGEKPQQIHLVLSPLRQRDRFEWAIEKAVELGVSSIVPVLCKRTVKTGVKLPRLNTIATSAMKQSKRSILPPISEPIPIATFLSQELSGEKLIGWCETESPIQQYHETIAKASEIYLLIGPEGDFTPEEVQLATAAGFQSISLGENRLRTETAAIHLLSLVKYVQGW